MTAVHQTIKLEPTSPMLTVKATKTGLYYSVESFEFHGDSLEYLTGARCLGNGQPVLRQDFYPSEIEADFVLPSSLEEAKGYLLACRHTPDNDGHCHNCGIIVNDDFHIASGCQCDEARSSLLPLPPSTSRTLLTESLAEQVAPLILELDRLQESQLKADITAHFSTYTRKFSSLDNQKHQDKSARNQERRIEIKKQLAEAGYECKPLQLPLEFYITPRYSERELVATGTGKKREQIYDVSPSLKEILGAELGREQSGCKHKVSAPTIQEGSDKALAEHLERCLGGQQ